MEKYFAENTLIKNIGILNDFVCASDLLLLKTPKNFLK